jgi:fructose-bisphosphate aldolase / 6-deoxy-5-ketofructose 1-phosphate synthase
MKPKQKITVNVPADVPKAKQAEYIKNYNTITHGKGRMMLFAGDQRMEHLNDDFVGKDVSPDDASPEHFFRIASKAKISCFAGQLGLLARYGHKYPKVPYMVKLNSKSNLVQTSQSDPLSRSLVNMEQVVRFKKTSGLNIVAIGYTIFLGSQFESQMFTEAAEAIFEAHQNGMLALVWIYPRGKAVPKERDPHLIAGATGVACCLGADFVKVNYPKSSENLDSKKRAEEFQEAVRAAGNTGVLCSGGDKMTAQAFLQQLWDQIHISGASGNATGRNIHMRPLDEAVRFTNAIYAVTIEDASVEEAMKIYNKI